MNCKILLSIIVIAALSISRVTGAESATRAAALDWKEGDRAAEGISQFSGKALTLLLRLNSSALGSVGEILNWKTDSGKIALSLTVEQNGTNRLLTAQLGFDAKERPLRLGMPTAQLSSNDHHVLVVRFSGPTVELFADGVLVDEDWPLGSLLTPKGAPTLGAGVRQLTVWNEALPESQVLELSGGAQRIAEREDQILGPQLPVGQFWKPRGFNAHVGDCMPFFHNGRFHLFYLFDRRNHQSKWGLGAHQWAHVSTTNLIDWEHHPMAVAITEQSEGSICTGSVFFHDGIYHAFYAVRMSDGSPAQLCDAISTDGIHFTKQPPLARLRSPYQGGPGRDPVVFRDPDTGLFHMLVTTELEKPAVAGRGGCLAQLVSRDLKTWEQGEPFIVPGYADQPECPDYFEWRGWYYLIFSNHGVARYRMSRHPLGPWLRPEVDSFDGAQIAVMKTAAFTGDRRLGAAFIRQSGYGGELIVREIIQNPDGTLATKWPAEMVPKTGTPTALKFELLTGQANGSARSCVLSATNGLSAVALGDAPRDFRLRARVSPGTNAWCYGLRLRGGARMNGGTELRFEPAREKAGLRPPELSANDENEYMSIYNVAELDRPFTLDLIVKGDLVDLCIDDRRTLAARLPKSDHTGLFLFSNDSDVRFENIEVRALSGEQ